VEGTAAFASGVGQAAPVALPSTVSTTVVRPVYRVCGFETFMSSIPASSRRRRRVISVSVPPYVVDEDLRRSEW
jgi:hypothetical protein